MEIKELEKRLNIRQRKFVAHILEGLSQTEAAIRAGYSVKTAASQASDLLKNPKVAAYRRVLAGVILEQQGLTPDAISLKLLEIYERCMQKKPVMEWDKDKKEWTESGEWRFNAKGAIKVLELLGKNAGMFTDKVEHSGAAALRIEMCDEVVRAGV
ncbi:MAG: terminase small subunit [Oscillospiraceae bacterium]|nr:terminase small subunit [Oscillospiraceae bacterium]